MKAKLILIAGFISSLITILGFITGIINIEQIFNLLFREKYIQNNTKNDTYSPNTYGSDSTLESALQKDGFRNIRWGASIDSVIRKYNMKRTSMLKWMDGYRGEFTRQFGSNSYYEIGEGLLKVNTIGKSLNYYLIFDEYDKFMGVWIGLTTDYHPNISGLDHRAGHFRTLRIIS